MRLRAGQNIIFSNFGVSNSSYNYRGKKIGDFLNNGDKKEVTFDTVEYYQIFFDEWFKNMFIFIKRILTTFLLC